jgi:hypothetical protein
VVGWCRTVQQIYSRPTHFYYASISWQSSSTRRRHITLPGYMASTQLSTDGIWKIAFHCSFQTSFRNVVFMSASPMFYMQPNRRKWSATRIYYKHNLVRYCFNGIVYTISPSVYGSWSTDTIKCRLQAICLTGFWRTIFILHSQDLMCTSSPSAADRN